MAPGEREEAFYDKTKIPSRLGGGHGKPLSFTFQSHGKPLSFKT
jgi:hypothetical protein